MQITQHLKAFISGMMGKPNIGLNSILASFLAPPDIKWLSLQEMERIQPKRKKTTDYIISGVDSDGMNILTPYSTKELPKRKYKKRKKKGRRNDVV